ncbi:hypothetical protein HKW90_01945 [Pseudomonas aeruginosa]|nr:hypothetical protein [Pseudomonas aeruginosa]
MAFVEMKTAKGEKLTVKLAEGAGFGKGKSFLPEGQSIEQIELERLKQNRKYFEDGCSCIHRLKTLQPCPTNMSDADAVAFYEQKCKCSRNYVPS